MQIQLIVDISLHNANCAKTNHKNCYYSCYTSETNYTFTYNPHVSKWYWRVIKWAWFHVPRNIIIGHFIIIHCI